MDNTIHPTKNRMKKSTKLVAATAMIAALMAGGTTFAAWTAKGEASSVRQLESAKAEIAMLGVTATKKVGTAYVPITLDQAQINLLEPGQELVIYHNIDAALYLGKFANLSAGIELLDQDGVQHDLAALAPNTKVTLEGNTRHVTPGAFAWLPLGDRPLTNLDLKTKITGSTAQAANATGSKLDGHADFRWVIRYTAPTYTAAQKQSKIDAVFMDFTKVYTYLSDATTKP